MNTFALSLLLGFAPPAPPAAETPPAEETPEPEAAEAAPAPGPETAPEPEAPAEAPEPEPETPVAAPEPPPNDATEIHEEVVADEARGEGASKNAGGTNASTRATTIGGPDIEEGGWRASFHGFFNAPMRFGIGKRADSAEGQGSTTFHSPIVPDDAYLAWQHTSHTKRSWAELWFGYGNDVAKGVVAVQAWDFSDVGYTEPQAQMGLGQAFVELTPTFRRSPVKLRAKIGAHANRYGMAGRYDTGAFETYLFGRTRYLGETVALDIPLRDVTLTVEHGFGATRPMPNIFNTARFTLVNHQHLMVKWRDIIDAGIHQVSLFAAEEDRPVDTTIPGSDDALVDPPDASMHIVGPDIRIDGGRAGYWYAGYSLIQANNARTIGPGVEVMHSFGGGFFDLGIVGNYLDGPGVRLNDAAAVSNGNGTLHTVMLQTEHSLHKILEGDDYYGEGWDLRLTLYGMLNFVKSDARLNLPESVQNSATVNNIMKIKYGADLLYEALPWLGAAVRFDRLQPNSEIPEHSFSILSPRLEFRTNWITHEKILIQYSRYFYNQRCASPSEMAANPATALLCVQPPPSPNQYEGFGAPFEEDNRGAPDAPPDVDLITVSASIYW